MEIKEYCKEYEDQLFEMIKEEGEDWIDYHSEEGRKKYTKAIDSSIVFVAFIDGVMAGYIRCREDDGFGVYVYDLLVRKTYRGMEIGRWLMEKICDNYSEQIVYVMSGIDLYYEKLGYEKEGTIFIVKKP